VHGTDQIAAAIHQADERVPAETTMLAVLMTTADAPAELRGGSRRIPCYAFPEEAARALARAAERGQWLRHPDTPLPELPGIRHDEAAALVAHALADGPRWLTVEEAARLLGCYGLPLAEWRLAHTTEKAGEMAEELGGPVALKATAPGLLHKTEAGAVRLNLKGRQEVTRAAGELAEVLTASGNPPEGFLLQRMATGVAELLVGVVHDPTFGPVVVVGAGGTSAELLGDVCGWPR
jgi:acyl-CoA synthetase (NDP forming)